MKFLIIKIGKGLIVRKKDIDRIEGNTRGSWSINMIKYILYIYETVKEKNFEGSERVVISIENEPGWP